jgi:hypothetical protein
VAAGVAVDHVGPLALSGLVGYSRPMPARFLLLGTYRSPRVRVGGRAFCLYRDADVVITSISGAPIPWPRCRAVDSRGGSGLLVTEALVRAVRTESAEALKYWFGVGTHAVWGWRKAFGVTQWWTPGSRRLLDETTRKANSAVRGRKLPPAAVRERRARAKELDLSQHLRAYQTARFPPWPAADAALLGTMPDIELARRLGRTRDAVHKERRRRGIARYRKPTPPEDRE